MIPKIIHYCWFGGNPLPKLAKKCIKSWKKFCPDYEIIRWDESNFDINSNQYVKEAYEAKKWAFVTDYVRLWAIYNYGGIYMDTDVEVIKPLDSFLECNGFTGFESNSFMVTGIMAGAKDNHIYKKLLDYYKQRHFVKDDGTYDLTTNTVIITDILKDIGFLQNNNLQSIDFFILYPSDYFCPKDWSTTIIKKTENTVCIHHFNASWWDATRRKSFKINLRKQKIKSFLKRFLGSKCYSMIMEIKRKIFNKNAKD